MDNRVNGNSLSIYMCQVEQINNAINEISTKVRIITSPVLAQTSEKKSNRSELECALDGILSRLEELNYSIIS